MSDVVSDLARKSAGKPAWGISLLLHAVLLLVLPWLWVAQGPSERSEPERPVGIVLARATEQPQYVSAEHAPVEDLAVEDALPSTSAWPAAASPELMLPHGDLAPPALRDLPGLATGHDSASRRVPGGVDAAAILAEEAQRRQREAALGPAGSVSLFGGAPAAGRSFVFLIDRSKSMGEQGLGALKAAERELVQALQNLQPHHRFQVVAYHHECVYLSQRRLLAATAENIAELRGHLSGLAAFGATEHEQALLSALHMEPDVIFLLTDGGDPVLTAGQRQRIRRVAGGRTAIHCIHFGFGPSQHERHFLQQLASENQGSYRYLDMSMLR